MDYVTRRMLKVTTKTWHGQIPLVWAYNPLTAPFAAIKTVKLKLSTSERVANGGFPPLPENLSLVETSSAMPNVGHHADHADHATLNMGSAVR